MMYLKRTSIALAFAALLPLSPLAADQAAEPVVQAAVPGPESAAQHLATAEEFRQVGQLRNAIREVEAAARLQRQAGVDAAETFWMLAELRYAQGDAYRTARALDAAAREAEKHGDLEFQARALFESAIHYSSINQHGRARSRLAQVDELIESRTISSALRAEIERRSARA